jgi:hypothetical protein
LANAAGNLPVRKNPDELDIRFQYSDPTSIVSHPQGTTVDINRKPDVIISSRNALENAHGSSSPNFAQRRPHLKLDWSVVLSCHEFKVHKNKNKRFPEGLTQIFARPFTNNELEDQDHEKLSQADDPATEPNEVEVDQESASLKRRLPLDAGGAGPPSKKVRNTPEDTPSTPTGTPSGSRVQSGTGAARKQELKQEKTQRAVSGRVQCASYALEMLSYSIGVHHAINILYTGTFFLFFSPFQSSRIANGGPRIF